MDTAIIPNMYSLMGSFLVVILLLLGALLFLRKVYGFKPNKKVNDWALSFGEHFDIQREAKGKNMAAEQLYNQWLNIENGTN